MIKKQQNRILDNYSGQTVGGVLHSEIEKGSKLRFVSAFFTIYAYEKLRDQLHGVSEAKFLFGNPGSVDDLDPGKKPDISFKLKDEKIKLSQALQQKYLAQDFAQWIEQKHTQIKTIEKNNFMHGKMYHIEKTTGQNISITGSSNFTSRGLGFSKTDDNIELNLLDEDSKTCADLAQWFDDIWKSNLVQDAKQQVLNALKRMSRDYDPELIYYKTLFHIFRKEIDSEVESEQFKKVHLYDTKIWQGLYPFQKHGVKGIINKLDIYDGCILADSVGLGKTFEALAVIKFFQLRAQRQSRAQRTLVLCPKKLEENWKAYHYTQNNPFVDDGFDYTILAHTDLTRDKYQNFNWGAFDLIVIDESHNFRNESKHRTDDDGKIIRTSRYQKLLEDVIGSGSRRAKVLMLSATPVNNSLRDLRNQIYLMTEGRGGKLSNALGIQDIGTLLGVAQRGFQQWQKQDKSQRGDLVDHLSGDLFTLLDGITIARSRSHVEEYYSDFISKSGGFPKRHKPDNKLPPTDKEGAISYDDLNDKIKKFNLAIYNPTGYLIDEERKRQLMKERFDQNTREHWLIGMMRVNFLKRLESSVASFRATLERTIEKIDNVENKINSYVENKSNGEIDTTPEDDEEDEDYIVTRLRYHLKDLDYERWRGDFVKDKSVLQEILDKIEKIGPDRDAKLAKLKKIIIEKIENPTKNKSGKTNRKILIFTTFADTAEYLYEHIKDDVSQRGAHIAQLSGGGSNQTTLGKGKFSDILDNFAPISRNRNNSIQEEIDVLIATDCISEGQNLQDCDTVINYDIHWNPVRLIQRFGRIDRIGSQSESVRMINFWPTDNLEKYLDLENRVKARMHLVDISATGSENLLEESQREVEFRNEQLRRLKDAVIELDDGPSLSDFTLSDFMAELLEYIQKNKKKLEEAPDGICALVNSTINKSQPGLFKEFQPGTIFFLRQKNVGEEKVSHVPIYPYYLVYVTADNEVYGTVSNVRETLKKFSLLARGQNKVLQELCDEFHKETDHGKKMNKYDQALEICLKHVRDIFEKNEAQELTQSRHGTISKASKKPSREGDNFELITWLIIK